MCKFEKQRDETYEKNSSPMLIIYNVYIYYMHRGRKLKIYIYLLNQRMPVNARGERTAGIVVKPK